MHYLRSSPVSNVRTVSDTKRSFYNDHTRPINSIYRRVVDELMVEMHLHSVNADYRYEPIYALGVATTFDRFMQGYNPEADKASIFSAICRSVQDEPQKYLDDAARLKSEASTMSVDSLLEQVKQNHQTDGLLGTLRSIAENPKFKYCRLFAVGLFSLVETMDAELIKDEKKLKNVLQALSETLHLDADKVQKDLELYRSNLSKMIQAQIVLEDIIKADRKKKEERAKAKLDAAIAPPQAG
jgi:photosystem II biogenesis protein Psp29